MKSKTGSGDDGYVDTAHAQAQLQEVTSSSSTRDETAKTSSGGEDANNPITSSATALMVPSIVNIKKSDRVAPATPVVS